MGLTEDLAEERIYKLEDREEEIIEYRELPEGWVRNRRHSVNV